MLGGGESGEVYKMRCRAFRRLCLLPYMWKEAGTGTAQGAKKSEWDGDGIQAARAQAAAMGCGEKQNHHWVL